MIITLKSYFPAIDIHFHYSNIQIPDLATVQDLFKVACAETGISITSPIQLKRNGVILDRSDQRLLPDAGIFPYDTIDVEIQTRGTLQRNTTTSTIYNLTPLERPLKRISSGVRTQPASKRRSPFLFEIVQGIEQIAREPIVIDYELEEMCKRGKRTISMIVETNK